MRKRHAAPSPLSKDTPQHRAKRSPAKEKTLGEDLVAWYRNHHRRLPWRARPGECQDPYRAWLAEIMLQQTTVVTVIPYYNRFLALWPDVRALAKAREDEVLREWAGLGYYSRARNLHACARAVVDRHGGEFPKTEKELIALPGIGPYTAAAVAALGFGVRTVPVDGNIERVMARLHALPEVPAKIKSKIKALAQQGLDAAPDIFPGDYAQALMDLGAGVCTPKAPKCVVCPIARACRAKAEGNPALYPASLPKTNKPTRRGDAYVIFGGKGCVMVEKRPDRGLLAGMIGLPGTGWEKREGEDHFFLSTATRLRHIGEIRHSFTHFNLHLKVIVGYWPKGRALRGRWIEWDRIETAGLPKVFRKVIDLVRRHQKEL